MKRILIIGATSAIASACARRWVGPDTAFFLMGRDPERLEAVAADLKVRGASAVHSRRFDATEMDDHADAIDAAGHALGGFDVVLIAHGSLPDQSACENDAGLTLSEFTSNATSVIALLTRLAERLKAEGDGVLAVITSVAGDRGRPSNYVYGSAKAAVSVFCEGLRARLVKKGVAVVDIRPGFVATPMTAGLPLPGLLVAQPDTVARRIVAAIDKGKDVVYVPGFWALIMWVIRHIPRSIFKRMSL